ncbi:MAG: SRPBCC family protein [Cyanobacteria bacterium P01_A01_bin.17]
MQSDSLSDSDSTQSFVSQESSLAADSISDEEELQSIPPTSKAEAEALAAVSLETEKLEKRQRQITAKMVLPYSPEQVWQVLTDYERLADFIPNLATSQRLEHPQNGIRLEQIGVQNALFLKFSARVVLDMTEDFLNTIHFDMIEGDFKAFSGDWLLEPVADGTQLTYSLFIWPKRTMPIIAIEKRLRYDLPRNLLAVQRRLEMFHAS